MATPHIAAEPGDFAPAVLMPGDPLRAKRMAASILDQPRLVSEVRNILAYTGIYNGPGEYQGNQLSIMASGMGMPSIGIYATELYRFYGVERIIRVGTAGGIAPQVKVGDTIIGTGAHTSSSMNELRIPGIHFSAVADFRMAAAALNAAGGDESVYAGTIVSNDHFYFAVPGQAEVLAQYGVLGVEMEAACLYAVAAEHGKAALTILTVSDHLFNHDHDMSAEERETLFQRSLKLAVAAAFA